MSIKPDFSFVIPSYNESQYIERTLKQFLPFRKEHNFEVIVVDGHSTDNTVALAKKYVDKVIVEERKTTIANARNLGAYAARSNIIIEMDAEVLYSSIPDLFKEIKKTFANQKIVAATVKFYIYPSETLLKDKIMDRIVNALIYLGLKLHLGIAKGECQIFRKESFIKIGGYDEKIAVSEDCALFGKFWQIGKIALLPGIKVYHSPRRFRKEGYLKLIFKYWVWNWIYMTVTKKSFYHTWKVIR
jgi:glycosyltransferase involved in cell wall biosynthesis